MTPARRFIRALIVSLVLILAARSSDAQPVVSGTSYDAATGQVVITGHGFDGSTAVTHAGGLLPLAVLTPSAIVLHVAPPPSGTYTVAVATRAGSTLARVVVPIPPQQGPPGPAGAAGPVGPVGPDGPMGAAGIPTFERPVRQTL